MQDDYSQFEQRKRDHIELALRPNNQASELNALDTLSLRHEALPDLDFNEITLTSQRFGRNVSKPFLVSSMTAGHHDAAPINRHLLEACATNQWAMGVGSQRRELSDKQAASEWKPLRRDFPQVSLFSNLGITQLISTPLHHIQQLMDSLEAEALIIHCNPLQEIIQMEGTPQFKGCWQALANAAAKLPLPLVVKETGCGFSQSTLKRLNDLGIAAVDVSGLGGTHWGRIEGQRATENSIQQKAALTFHNWGINTVQSIQNANRLTLHFEVWGSGGVRHGLDAAKLLALGATTVGLAKPMLTAALQSAQQVHELMTQIEYELKIAMFCTGSRVLNDLRGKVDQ